MLQCASQFFTKHQGNSIFGRLSMNFSMASGSSICALISNPKLTLLHWLTIVDHCFRSDAFGDTQKIFTFGILHSMPIPSAPDTGLAPVPSTSINLVQLSITFAKWYSVNWAQPLNLKTCSCSITTDISVTELASTLTQCEISNDVKLLYPGTSSNEKIEFSSSCITNLT